MTTTTFTLNNGHTYEITEKGYYYVTMDGKKTRCKAASYEMAKAQFDKETEEFEARMEQFDESVATEEIKEARKAAKADRKPRRSKDIAHESNGVTLTAKQADFIRHLPDTYFWEDGLNSTIWVDCLCDDIQGQFAGKPMTVGAMISTLCEKGLGTRATDRRDGRKCTSFALTDLGKRVASELGLN